MARTTLKTAFPGISFIVIGCVYVAVAQKRQFFHCCLRIRCRENVFSDTLPSNGNTHRDIIFLEVSRSSIIISGQNYFCSRWERKFYFTFTATWFSTRRWDAIYDILARLVPIVMQKCLINVNFKRVCQLPLVPFKTRNPYYTKIRRLRSVCVRYDAIKL
jgi:hypothetical protein